jgi:hypothetical protein
MPDISWSDPAIHLFVVLPLWLFVGLLWGTDAASRRLEEPPDTRRRALLVVAIGGTTWLAVTWFAAASGVLRLWDTMPPPFLILLIGILGVTFALGGTTHGGRLARGLPLWVLVGIQGFRLPLELAMHLMYQRGIMPVQMSYSGRNFDIVTGITALVVAALLYTGRAGRGLVFAWNVLGLLLVVNVATVGVLSTPAFRLFGDDRLNTWITYPPFIWLPAVMVVMALSGHLVVFRALAARKRIDPL